MWVCLKQGSENMVLVGPLQIGAKDFTVGGGLTNERPGTDHVISGPMRGLKKTASDGADTQTNTQTDNATL